MSAMGCHGSHLNSDASNSVAFIDLPCSRSNDLSPMIGQTISHYSVVEKLAGDGVDDVGVVYQPEDASLDSILSDLACGDGASSP